VTDDRRSPSPADDGRDRSAPDAADVTDATDAPDGTADATTDEQVARRRRGLLVAGVGALAAAAVVVALVVGAGGGPSSTAEPTSGATTADAAPGGTATDAAGGDATDGATDAGGADGSDASGAPADAAVPPTDRELSPVDVGGSPSVTEGVTLRVESVTAVDGQAAVPGEVAGPAVSVTVVVDNASGTPFDLSRTVVNVYSGDAFTPGNGLVTGTSPFPAEVAAGSTATATYVVAVPGDERDRIRVTVDTGVELPVVVVDGRAS